MTLPTHTTLLRGDQFKRKRNKQWKPVPASMVGRKITKRHAALGFEFRRVEADW